MYSAEALRTIAHGALFSGAGLAVVQILERFVFPARPHSIPIVAAVLEGWLGVAVSVVFLLQAAYFYYLAKEAD